MISTVIAAPQALPFSNCEVITLFVWILMVIAGLALAGIIWFTVRTLKKIDANQTLMFDRLEKLEKGLSTLQGEHNILKEGHHRNHGS